MCIEHALRLLSDRTINTIIYVSIAFSLAQRSWLDSQVKYTQTCSQGFSSSLSLERKREKGTRLIYINLRDKWHWQSAIWSRFQIYLLKIQRKNWFYYLKDNRQISWPPIQSSGLFFGVQNGLKLRVCLVVLSFFMLAHLKKCFPFFKVSLKWLNYFKRFQTGREIVNDVIWCHFLREFLLLIMNYTSVEA